MLAAVLRTQPRLVLRRTLIAYFYIKERDEEGNNFTGGR
jgi:hypothetical protein